MLKPNSVDSALRDRQLQALRRWHDRRQQPRFWLAVLGLIWSLWVLRHEWLLMAEYFTWAALRHAVMDHVLPWFVLLLCLWGLVARLIDRVWQQRRDRKLERQLDRILTTGPKHRLWRQVQG